VAQAARDSSSHFLRPPGGHPIVRDALGHRRWRRPSDTVDPDQVVGIVSKQHHARRAAGHRHRLAPPVLQLRCGHPARELRACLVGAGRTELLDRRGLRIRPSPQVQRRSRELDQRSFAAVRIGHRLSGDEQMRAHPFAQATLTHVVEAVVREVCPARPDAAGTRPQLQPLSESRAKRPPQRREPGLARFEVGYRTRARRGSRNSRRRRVRRRGCSRRSARRHVRGIRRRPRPRPARQGARRPWRRTSTAATAGWDPSARPYRPGRAAADHAHEATASAARRG
jgi:hypothetical protein